MARRRERKVRFVARRRNPDTIASIADASWRLFGEKGYDATSYGDVSAASGVNRATVQHYFPRKEMMASINLERLRSCAVAVAEDAAAPDAPPFARLYVLGQVYLASLMSCEAARTFLCDVLDRRLLTDETISADFNWSIEYVLGRSFAEGDEAVRDDMVVAMGGLYELMFRCVREGRDLDIPVRLQPAFRGFARLTGFSQDDCDEMFARYELPVAELAALGRAAYNRSFEVSVLMSGD